ncbi:putative transcriptional regulator [Oceanicola granulosus HTCC2516]|uniref:Putative transcriptional regulator n=1 Tax=Oceanicola granulosus (strain ATCC BAA-861 / DSM 15982 / KCTC 12143 / HTCC2516) TaxID=314256 RepID=Q2CCI3_OCEGH|nr:sugar-binding transcriptional regulator [Oceanicola granulosus]EAR50335.1 putative transcriptional regulator [Oceanicola granulosus HTCC2516]
MTPGDTRLDDAARAGWLYYVAGNTQDEIARKLGVSRQRAQRLVSLAVSERLVKVRIDHPIGRCMDLARALTEQFALVQCDVVPSDPAAPDLLTGVAIAATAELERVLKRETPQVIALGTGRALKACVEQMPRMDCPQHKLVSLLGNIMSDGSATSYNATIRMADRVGAQHYPFPLPVLAQDIEDLRHMHSQQAVRSTLELCAQADVALVGIGHVDRTAPVYADGFLTDADWQEVSAKGATGEIIGWIFDARGRLVDSAFTARLASAPLPDPVRQRVIAVALGPAKVAAIRAALLGRLVNGLITDEATAEALLAA